MQEPTNRVPLVRWNGAAVLVAEQSPFARTREEFVDRILAEAVAFQVENAAPVDPDETPIADEELNAAIEDVRDARHASGLAAYVLAVELRRLMVACGYCDDDELPTYRPKRRR